jgi:DNA repair protein RadC
LVLVHNHPSGSTDPSDDDMAMTRRLVDAGRLLGIEVLDHIIVANPSPMNGYASFKERGLL